MDNRRGWLLINQRIYGGIGCILGLIIAALLVNTVFESFYFDHHEKKAIIFWAQ
jgi:hypothetical protein